MHRLEMAAAEELSRFQTFYRIALALTKPGIGTTAILCLVFAGNDYSFAITVSGPGSATLPVAALHCG